MKYPLVTLARSIILAIALVSSGNCEDQDVLRSPTVSEMIVIPLLNSLGAEYDDAKESRRREIEYSAFMANRTYWIHTSKLGDQERSSRIENSLGILNTQLLVTDEYRRLFTDWKTPGRGDDFSAIVTYNATRKDGEVRSLRIATADDWKKMHFELQAFVEELASRHKKRVQRIRQARDKKADRK